MNSTPCNIVIADDHPVVRIGAIAVLEKDSTNSIVGDVGTFRDLWEKLRTCQCHVLLVSLRLPGFTESGIATIAKLRTVFPDTKLIVYPDMCTPAAARVLLTLGVLGLVSKQAGPEQLRLAVDAVKKGHRFVSSDIYGRLPMRTTIARLSPAEENVLQLLAEGLSVSEIARHLGKAVATISAQKRSAMMKLDIHSAIDLYAFVSAWRSDAALDHPGVSSRPTTQPKQVDPDSEPDRL